MAVDEESAGGTGPDHEAVFERLERVHDPELDRSIVDLEYVEHVRLEGGQVDVSFVLPTAWCSPAFAWMMATDIREEVGDLPGVDAVTVGLLEHMHAEEITTGVNRELAFEEAFEDATDGVETVRRDLDEKARFARQHAACEALLDAGLDPEQVVALTPADVDLEHGGDVAAVDLREGDVFVAVPREPLAEYLEKARETGLVAEPDDPLFADRDGDPVGPDRFEAVHRDARLAASNITGQGAICSALHEARNGVTIDD